MKESFILYTEYAEQIEFLDMAQRGALFTAIMAHETGADTPELDTITAVVFSMIRKRLERDAARYEEKVEARREAGRQGGRPKKQEEKANGFSEKAKKANGFSEKQTKAKKADPVPDPVPVPDNDIKHIVPIESGRRGGTIPYQAVIDHLNKVCGTKYAATTAKTRECIRARSREGATLEDFKAVIDRQAKEWLNTDRAKYLRPETLFGTKFDGYLHAPEARAAPKKSAQQFNAFHQRDQDYDAIQKAMIARQIGESG